MAFHCVPWHAMERQNALHERQPWHSTASHGSIELKWNWNGAGMKLEWTWIGAGLELDWTEVGLHWTRTEVGPIVGNSFFFFEQLDWD